MIKSIKTQFFLFFVGSFLTSSLSAQTFVDLSIIQIMTPDSVLFCDSKNIPIKVLVKLQDGLSVDSFQMSYQLAGRTPVVEKVYKRLNRNDTFQYAFRVPCLE